MIRPRSKSSKAPVLLFARNFFRYPSMLGSLIPSSRFLVNDLLSQIDWHRARVIVEYGPGVGTITREILKRLRPNAKLVAIELNQEFAGYLRDEISDPRLRVVHASACDVSVVLERLKLGPADYIISGIPYTTMSERLRRKVLEESRAALGKNGVFLVYQFTRTVLPYLESSFRTVHQGFQPLNILPARIYHCTP
jgi:phospholipid N-methyltransferase